MATTSPVRGFKYPVKLSGSASYDPPTNTVASNAVTIDLNRGNDQFVDLAPATGTVTITLTAPEGVGSGNLLIKQDASARDITWAAGTGITTGYWLGTEPTWTGDTAEYYRVVSWLFDGTNVFLAFTNEHTATF